MSQLIEPWIADNAFVRRRGRIPIRYANTTPTINTKINLYNAKLILPLPPDPNVRPTGPDYMAWEDLYTSGDLQPDGTIDISSVLQRCPSGKIVTFPEGKFICRGFTSNSTSYQAGIQVPKHVKGIIGSGRGTLGGSTGTIFTMLPNSSNAVANGWIPDANSSTPVQVNVLKQLDPIYTPVYRNFQVAGTEQGHIFSLFQIFNTPGAATVSDLLLSGWDGNDGKPPGETSALAISGVGAHTITKVEIDGRRVPNGTVYGAMGMTFQNSVGATFNQCNVHHCRAAGFVLYQSFNSTLLNFISDATVPTDKALGNGSINMERTAGTKMINSTIIGRPSKVHITHSNDTWTLTRDGVTYTTAGGSLEIIDPQYNALWADGYLYIQTWIPYYLGSFGTGNSMTYPGSAAPGPDTSPSVHKANGTHITYKWVFDKHYIIT